MLALIPRDLPPLPLILADLGNPSTSKLAAALGVTERTARRWVADGQAPRPALLALFWVTSWGASAVDCQAVNDARLHAAIARNVREENARLVAEVARLVRLGSFGSANDAGAYGLAVPLPPGRLVVARVVGSLGVRV